MTFKNWLLGLGDGFTSRNRRIVWEKAHGKGTAGRNGLGDSFWLYDLSPAFPPEKRWRLRAKPPCPDHRRFCSQHDEVLYHGSDYGEAKQAAQEWANQRWPLSSSTETRTG